MSHLPARQRIERSATPEQLAEQVAVGVIERLVWAQAGGRSPVWVLTGGSVSRLVHAAIAASHDRNRVDWRRVEVWWGDERYVPGDDEDRNAGQAFEDLLDSLPLDPHRVHAMPASDDGYSDLETAARAYADDLAQSRRQRPAGDPWFDLLMLGVGPDGHCASMFPGHPALASTADVVPVRDSPKPPPERLSLGMRALQESRWVFFVAAGAEKAEAVARAVKGDDPDRTPATLPKGRESTMWYVDHEAATGLVGL